MVIMHIPKGGQNFHFSICWFRLKSQEGEKFAKRYIFKLKETLLKVSHKGKVHKKSKKKITSVSFMYVCVAKNAELLVVFYFFLHLPIGNFLSREVLNHHTPPVHNDPAVN